MWVNLAKYDICTQCPQYFSAHKITHIGCILQTLSHFQNLWRMGRPDKKILMHREFNVPKTSCIYTEVNIFNSVAVGSAANLKSQRNPFPTEVRQMKFEALNAPHKTVATIPTSDLSSTFS